MNSPLLYFFSCTPKLKNHQNKLTNTQHNKNNKTNQKVRSKKDNKCLKYNV